MKIEEYLLNDKKAFSRIKMEQSKQLAKFILLTGNTAKQFDELAKLRFPNIDFKLQKESAKRILLKAKI